MGTFERPFFLWLIPLAVLAVFLLYRRKTDLGFSTLSLTEGIRKIPLDRLQALVLSLIAGVALLILAGPVEYQTEIIPRSEEHRNFLFALDISESMKDPIAPDSSERKLDQAKTVMRDFILSHPTDCSGLVSFNWQAYLEWSLTSDCSDQTSLLWRLFQLQVDGGTSIGKGMISSLRHLETAGQGKGVLIILSDGISTVTKEEAEEITVLVDKTRAKPYWILIEKEGENLPQVEDFGRFILDLGGEVYHVSPEELDEAFDEISRLEKTTVTFEERQTTSINYGILPKLFLVLVIVAVFLERIKEI